MKAKSRQSGRTLIEMVVVIAITALLVGLGVPAGRAFLNSFETESGTRSMISAALASARAVAAREQKYAGIRFQQNLDGNQYMIFIVHDFEKTGLAPGFRAVEGLKPIKLPDSAGVMDLRYRTDLFAPPGDGIIDDDTEINNLNVVRDTTSFSIVFSPSGKMVIHDVRVRNRDGVPDTKASLSDTSYDDVFNKKGDVDERSPELIAMGMGNEIGMFYQDDYFGVLDTPDYPDLVDPDPDLGLGPEPSRRSFIIYEKEKFRRAYEKGQAWSGYLVRLVSETIYINPYTGTIISAD